MNGEGQDGNGPDQEGLQAGEGGPGGKGEGNPPEAAPVAECQRCPVKIRRRAR